MMKAILLSLLLVPCVTHTMEKSSQNQEAENKQQEEITKHENDSYETYAQGNKHAIHGKKLDDGPGAYYAYEEKGSYPDSSDERRYINERLEFEILQQQYAQQEASKK